MLVTCLVSWRGHWAEMPEGPEPPSKGLFGEQGDEWKWKHSVSRENYLCFFSHSGQWQPKMLQKCCSPHIPFKASLSWGKNFRPVSGNLGGERHFKSPFSLLLLWVKNHLPLPASQWICSLHAQQCSLEGKNLRGLFYRRLFYPPML